jgi:hypothetical protein
MCSARFSTVRPGPGIITPRRFSIWRLVNKAGMIFPVSIRFQCGGVTHGNQEESQDHEEEEENLKREGGGP